MLQLWSKGQTDAANLNWPVFFTRLARTVAWCNHKADACEPLASLRTSKLEPPHLRRNRDDEVCWVGIERDRQLGWLKQSLIHPPVLNGGRLLAYFPDADLCDGAAELLSKGFFDVFNMPAWDTWVAYFEDRPGGDESYGNYLVAYVPAVLVELANSGIIVNPEQCIAWLSATDTLLARALSERDIIL